MIGAAVARLLDDAPFTRTHRRVWLLSSMGIMLDGFDFFIMGVAIPIIRQEWEIGAWEVGLISSAAIVGAIVGASTLGALTDRIGRRLAFKIDLGMFVVFALASALAPSLWWLILFRFLLGVGIGADYPISSSYVSEIAPARVRSRLLVATFSFQAVGQLLGVVVGLVILNVDPTFTAWRWMLAFGVVPALIIVWLRRTVPESPKWLASSGRLDEAADVLSVFCDRPVDVDELRGATVSGSASASRTTAWSSGPEGTALATVEEVDLDLELAWSAEPAPPREAGPGPDAAREVDAVDQAEQADEADEAGGTRATWRDLFSPRWRRVTVLTAVPWFLMDIATYGVGVFTPTIIAAVTLSSAQADSQYIADDITSTRGAAFVDIFLVVGFAIALLLITRAGKVRLQVIGFVAMAVGLFVLAYASSLPEEDTGALVLVLVGFSVFNLFMNAGPNATTYVMPAEVFSTRVRAAGSGFAAAAGKTGAAVGTLLFPAMQDGIGLPATLVVVGGGCLVAAGVTLALRSAVRPAAT